MNPAQEFIFVGKYARWVDAVKRRETYLESVDRYFGFFEKKFGDRVPAKVFHLCRKQVLAMGAMPSMRAFWTAGPALEQNHICGYNCCSMVIKDLQSFAEMFYILMCGTGVGFSVERQFIKDLPDVKPYTGVHVGTHVVGDSREGWATSLRVGLEAWFDGKDIEFDYSEVERGHPRGSRLKTMGGRASGPEPLRRLHSAAKAIVQNAAGGRLSSLDVLDICNCIGAVTEVGGIRRAAEISFSDLDDDLMRHAKDAPIPPQRWQSNNSAVYFKRPDMVTFMREWTALAASGTGERGIFNVTAATQACPRRAVDKLGMTWEEFCKYFRTNPCVPAGTEILTKNGYVPIDTLVGKKVEVWNGYEWSEVIPSVTGYNQLLVKVEMSDGRSLTCTLAHKWWTLVGGKRASELQVGDKLVKTDMPVVDFGEDCRNAYAQGFISAEGMDDYEYLYVYEPKRAALQRLEADCRLSPPDDLGRIRIVPQFEKLPKAFVPFKWSLQSRLSWLAGLFDGDGCVLKEGGVQLVSVNRKFLSDLQKLLTTVGVQSKVCSGSPAEERQLPDGHGGYKKFFCQQNWRICVGATQVKGLVSLGLDCKRLDLRGFSPNRDASRYVAVTAVEDAGIADVVYCFTEPKRHLGCFEGVVTGQCGEILLMALLGEFCNLTEVVIRAEDTFADLVEKVKSAVWMGAMQACLTDFPYIRPSFKAVCDEEMLLGVSLTGQMDNPKLLTPERLQDLKEVAIRECRKACKALGRNMSAAITTGKPSGTVSQLVNCASGCHPRYARYYLRRYRLNSVDPLFRMLRDQGVVFTPDNGQGPEAVELRRQELVAKGRSAEEARVLVPDWSEDQVMTWVCAFPEAAPAKAVTRDQVSAIDQLEWYLKIKKNWCEHNQSTSVYVRDDEWLKVGTWVWEHFDEITGISFFPYDNAKYEQPPYEEISKEQYEKAVRAFPKIDYSQLSRYEDDDNTSGSHTLACAAGGCETR